jgi:hypothetical protein
LSRLVPAIHAFLDVDRKNVDARDKPGHSEFLMPQQHRQFSPVGALWMSAMYP